MEKSKLEIKENFLLKEHSIIISSDVSISNNCIKTNKLDQENLTPSSIKKYISKFNKSSNDLILDYNYEVINPENINIIILFKHILSKMNESQKYFKAKLSINKENEVIEMYKDSKIKLDLNIPKTAEELFINYIKIENKVCENKNVTTINFHTDDNIENYKNFELLSVYIKNTLNQIMKNFDT
jgi:hypothetical protein